MRKIPVCRPAADSTMLAPLDVMKTRDNAMYTIEFDLERFAEAANVVPADEPIIMVNMLKFLERADYGDRTDVTPCSGREAYYERYAPIASRLVQADGAEIFWFGKVLATVVAPDGEDWDDFILVKYRSIGALQRHFENPEYRDIIFHRTAALVDSRFLVTQTGSFS